jgi:hypothetical protein
MYGPDLQPGFSSWYVFLPDEHRVPQTLVSSRNSEEQRLNTIEKKKTSEA